jgi:DNA polymerase-3 subunit alpha
MTSKAVLKDVGRVLGISFDDQNRIAKMIPVVRGKPTKLKVMIAENTPDPAFKQAYEHEIVKVYNDKKEEVGSLAVRHWVDMAMRIEGTNKTFGVHAAGVVISSQPLDEIVPLQKNNDGSVITQYFMEDLESLGLLKMDFLGLKNLTTIQRAASLIKETKGIDLDLDLLPLEERKALDILAKGKIKKLPDDVQKTHKLLEAGNLEGIFQLESDGMKQIVRDLKPSGIEDVSSILALYRPGPLDAGLIPKFIDRKHGREKIEFQHKLLEPILKETYGVLVYQEQIMKMAQDLSGYSLGEADLLRRAMGKKKGSEMQKQKEKFIDGATNNGVTPDVANELFDQMVLFAEYCLSYDTKVLTVEHGAIEIGKIVTERIECEVYSVDKNGFVFTQSIVQWHDRGEREICEYTLENGSIIRATKDHKFMTSDGEMISIDDIFEKGLDLKQINMI